MQPFILKADEAAEYYFDEGCFILELSNTVADSDVSIARARVKPGVTTQLHRLHGVIERYVLLSGVGSVVIGDMAATTVTTGDVVVIPPECPQQITNIGTDDLVFLAICSPRFRHEVYEQMV